MQKILATIIFGLTMSAAHAADLSVESLRCVNTERTQVIFSKRVENILKKEFSDLKLDKRGDIAQIGDNQLHLSVEEAHGSLSSRHVCFTVDDLAATEQKFRDARVVPRRRAEGRQQGRLRRNRPRARRGRPRGGGRQLPAQPKGDLSRLHRGLGGGGQRGNEICPNSGVEFAGTGAPTWCSNGGGEHSIR